MVTENASGIPTRYDTVIKNGTFVDGTRLPRVVTDLGLSEGRVARVGRIDDVGDARVLNAEGLIVAPGFVDLHTHYDAQIHWDPYCTISAWHGITSVALGNCGFGFAPCHPADRERAMQMMTRNEAIPMSSMQEGMPWRWETFPEWLDNLDALPKGVNLLCLVPLSPLMMYVMGLEASKDRPATPAEQKEMQRLLHQAMDAGACGFSLQRNGPHSAQMDIDGRHFPTDCMADEDVLALAAVLRERDEGVIQITQTQGGEPVAVRGVQMNRDVAFLERLAEVAQRPILHNAIGVLEDQPDVHRHQLEWLRDCRERGLPIVGQGANVRNWFTYTLEDWNMYDASPAWNQAARGSTAERLRNFADPELRARMRAEHEDLIVMGSGGPVEDVKVYAVPDHPELEAYLNRPLGEIAREEGKHVVDAMLDIAVAGKLKVEFRTRDVNGSDPVAVAEVFRDENVLAGVSDGGAHIKFFTGGAYATDLLAWLVRDEKQLTLEEAHYHLSYLPARLAGFADRGALEVGAPADIVIYDLEQLARVPEWEYEVIHDQPGNEWRRIQRADGYRWILVNGEVTFQDGACTGATPGHLLRNGRIQAL